MLFVRLKFSRLIRLTAIVEFKEALRKNEELVMHLERAPQRWKRRSNSRLLDAEGTIKFREFRRALFLLKYFLFQGIQVISFHLFYFILCAIFF